MKNISFKAIIVGAVVDILGTNLWGFVLGVYLLLSHTVTQEILRDSTALSTVLREHTLIVVVNLIVGVLFSIIGGYIAASIARQKELLHGTLSSFLCVGIGLYEIISGTTQKNLVLALVLLLISPALGLLGGYIKSKRPTLPSESLNNIKQETILHIKIWVPAILALVVYGYGFKFYDSNLFGLFLAGTLALQIVAAYHVQTFALKKGHSSNWVIPAALFGIFGIIIVYLLPRRKLSPAQVMALENPESQKPKRDLFKNRNEIL
jgi:MFS family permease